MHQPLRNITKTDYRLTYETIVTLAPVALNDEGLKKEIIRRLKAEADGVIKKAYLDALSPLADGDEAIAAAVREQEKLRRIA
ncbi:MAG: hypothetical protein NZ585_14770 [Chloracidobacterium sp.]|nr:hypothetical protein [Chloracidobacterium sp.]MDW8217973.1 hypothetical protein [Acidobacteriota bacterium]